MQENQTNNPNSKRVWYKSWRNIVVILILWPFFLSLWIWRKEWNKTVRTVLLVLVWLFISYKVGTTYIYNSKSDKNDNNSSSETLKNPVPLTNPSPTVYILPSELLSPTTMVNNPIQSIALIPTSISIIESSQIQTPSTQPRKLIMGSTSDGVEFYKKVESLRKQGVVYGELYTEFESDAVVDVNPNMQSVQLSLRYPTIIDTIDESDKKFILNDFKKIKTLAEQDSNLILPDYGTLRLFVLTFHDKEGKARGELEQMMIDSVPQWSNWK